MSLNALNFDKANIVPTGKDVFDYQNQSCIELKYCDICRMFADQHFVNIDWWAMFI